MPEKDFILNTEYDLFSRVLILDDPGELSTVLVDFLLNHGCIIYYFGSETKDSFYYLLEKKNFVYLENCNEIGFPERIDYCLYVFKEKFEKRNLIIDLSKKQRTKFLFCGNASLKNLFEKEELLGKKDINARVVFYDCLYGPRITSGLLGNIFFKSIKEKNVNIGESAEKIIYPIFSESLAEEILRIIFSSETDNKSFFVHSGETNLKSFVKSLNKYLFENHYTFGAEKSQDANLINLKERTITEEKDELIEKTVEWFNRSVKKDEISVEELKKVDTIQSPIEKKREDNFSRLESLFDGKRTDFENNPKECFASDTKDKSFSKKFTFGLKIFFVLTLVFYFLPAVIIVISGYLGLRSWNSFQTKIKQEQFSEAVIYEQKIEKNLSFTKTVLAIVGPFYSVSGLEKQVENLNSFIEFAQKINNSNKYFLSGERELVKLEKKLVSGQVSEWKEKSNTINSDFSLAYQEASLAQTILPKVEKTLLLIDKDIDLGKHKKDLETKREQLLKTISLINSFPNIVGSGGRKTYVLLLQNNLELRPTGGFISAYGIINVENGRLINFEVHDVYETDRQLKGKVEPPEKIKQLLGEKIWYFRDSNWSPDFPTSAQKAEWFLDKETQLFVDGVIAVNLNTFQKILEIIGEVSLIGQQTTITSNNLLIKAQSTQESQNLNSTQNKKSFLVELTEAVFEKIKNTDENKFASIGKMILDQLEQKEIMLYFNDVQLQKVVGNLSWDGSIKSYSPAAAGTTVIPDYLHINETNVGINKINLFIERNIDHQIVLDGEGKISEKVQLSYTNKSQMESYPLGSYKNYLRVYLPWGTRLNSVFVNKQHNGDLWTPVDLKNIEIFEEFGKTVLGVFIEIPAKSSKQIEFSYELSQKLDLSKKLNSYLLFIQKQSGGISSDYNLRFTYSANLVPLRVLPRAKIEGDQLTISESLDKDKIFQIDLAK